MVYCECVIVLCYGRPTPAFPPPPGFFPTVVTIPFDVNVPNREPPDHVPPDNQPFQESVAPDNVPPTDTV